MKRTHKLLSILFTLALLLSLRPVPAQAAVIGDRDTIFSVAITVDRPIAGEPLANCVPKTTLCDISCTWNVRGLNGNREVPSTTIAEAGKTYYLAMVLRPRLPLYTFAASVTGTVNGDTVTVTRMSNTQVACMARLTPMTRETEVAVSVAQPAVGATPGTPTAAGGHTVSDVSWWRSSPSDLVTGVQLGADDVFTKSYNYWMEATVTAGNNSLFGVNTAVTVNGKSTVILARDLEANTITFRYYVGSEELLAVAGNIYVADGSGGYWYLTHGDTKTNAAGTYSASYVNGILTLTNTGSSTIGGTYQVPNQTWYTGIYADGDLTLHVNGDFHFDLSGTPEDASYVYGIYVVGDLTLVNVSDDDCTVSFTPADGVLATHGSNGIYCEIGSLTVENEGGGDFVLNADAVGVRPVDGAVKANFTNNGIYADGSITIGNGCTVNATAADVALSAEGTTTSRGIYANYGLTIGKNAVVTATGGNINPSRSATTLSIGFSQLCYGVEVREDITVNGGTLTAKGGNIDYGALNGGGNATYGNQNSYGIYAADITLSGGAITAKAGICRSSALVTGSLSEGIYCHDLTVSSGTLTAAADDAWWESTGLCVRNNLTQTGGTIIGTGDLAVCAGSTTGTGSRGIYVANTLTASGGSLTGTGGTMGGNPFPSVGLQTATINLSGTAEVAGIGGLTTKGTIETPLTGAASFANYPGDSIGVRAFSNLKVDDDAVLTATGGTVKGDRSSAVKAMSIGLGFRLADGFTISGSGTVVATGGETHYGSKGHSLCDSSCGIYGDAPSLTISGTTVTATGGSVSTKTVSGNGTTMGGVSYGLHLPAGSLTLQKGAKLTATGGENPNYSTLSTQPSKHNDSYGAYIKGDITVTDSVFTATGSISHRTVGLLHGGAVTLNGLNSRLTASADTYRTEGYASDGKYSRGIRNGDTNESWAGGAYTVNGGIMLLRGQTGALSYSSSNTLTATTIQKSFNWDGSAPSSERSPASFTSLAGYRYVKADNSTVAVTIKDWTYGDAASTPTYTAYEGEPTFLWTGTTRAGAAYSADTAPMDAGSYTVTVTYPGGQTGSADFAVKPRSITTCSWNFKGKLTYNGREQTQSVTIRYGETELVEGTDYTLSGNKQTNAGNYTLTITGTGNFGGSNTGNFTVYQKTPTVEDFDIPAIGEYAYTGNPVELALPTLKDPLTGGGTVALYYDGGPTPPSAIGEHTVTFNITEGTNFIYANNIEYGTLVIKAADIATIVLRDLNAPQAGKTPDTNVSSGYPALYTVSNVRWLDETDAVANSFEEGKFYTAEITVFANYIGDGSGNRFNFAESVTASIDGTAVTGEGSSVTVNGDDTVTIRYKFPEAAAAPTGVASFNGTGYATLAAAIAAAETAGGGTVQLLADVTESMLMLNPGVTVDINGKTLTTDGVMSFGGYMVDNSADKSGKIVCMNGMLVPASTNPDLVIWNGTDGYFFTEIEQVLTQVKSGGGSYKLTFLPRFTQIAKIAPLLADGNGGADHGVKIMVKLLWDGGGKTLTYSDNMIKTVYSGNAFTVTLTGYEDFIALGLKLQVAVECNGVSATSTPITVS